MPSVTEDNSGMVKRLETEKMGFSYLERATMTAIFSLPQEAISRARFSTAAMTS